MEYQQSIIFIEKIEDEVSMVTLIAHIKKQLIFNRINGIAMSRNFVSLEEFRKYQQPFDQPDDKDPKAENIFGRF